MADDVAGGWLVPVATGEVLGLLATVPVGRVAYLDRALPAIQVTTHLVDGGEVIIRTQGRTPVIPPARSGNVVLAYEAAAAGFEGPDGWSVTVTGTAALVRDEAEIARYERSLPRWPAGSGAGQLIRVHPGLVRGYRMAEPGAGGPPPFNGGRTAWQVP